MTKEEEKKKIEDKQDDQYRSLNHLLKVGSDSYNNIKQEIDIVEHNIEIEGTRDEQSESEVKYDFEGNKYKTLGINLSWDEFSSPTAQESLCGKCFETCCFRN